MWLDPRDDDGYGSLVRGSGGFLSALSGGVGLVALLVIVATQVRDVPRCPVGLVPLGARCCGEGQRLVAGRCEGKPSRCSDGLTLTAQGCIAAEGRVHIHAGESSWRPPDTTLGTEGERARTGHFAIDRVEVTWVRYAACVASRACPAVKPIAGGDPGQAVHGITRDEARTYCRFAGGRLPRDAEWLRVAIGDVEKRYPWGDPDALCLRAAYGLATGPCGVGATGPDTAGARPWGATEAGVLDVAGNVGEWVDDGGRPGEGVVRGGSFLDESATALRARFRRVLDPGSRQASVGFRCVYDVADERIP